MPKATGKARPSVGVSVKDNGRSGGNGSAKRIRCASGAPAVSLSGSGKVTQSTFEEFIAEELAVHPQIAHECWKKLLCLIRSALQRGLPVTLTNIGTLDTYKKRGTVYRHPSTGKIRTARPRRALRLFTSPNMRDLLDT